MGNLEHAIVGLVDQYGYFGLFVALVLGNIGAPVGSEVVLPVAGALTSTGHLSNIWLTVAVAVAGELAGQSIAYAVGRFGGIPVLEKYGKYVGFHHKQLDVVHGFFERWGTFSIFICRFLPVLRGIVGYPAGIAQMNLVHFYLWTFFGSLVFCGALNLLGYSLGDHLDAILPLLHRGGLLLAAVAIVAIVAAAFVMRARMRRGALERAARSDVGSG